MYGRSKVLLALALVTVLIFPSIGNGARIKDIASIKGIRTNQLFGYGLVTGLNGSGDKGGLSLTTQGLVNMLERLGIRVSAEEIKVSNVAAVMVSASLPPFARIGQKMDVTLSSIGDAKSLQGGTLLLTPLSGVDGNVYALAQGPVSVGGFSASGAAGGGVSKNHPTVGRITGGATIEREIPYSLNDRKELTVVLTNPDFNTAVRMTDTINARFGEGLAKALDSGTLKIHIPQGYQDKTVYLIAQLGEMEVTPDMVAKVIVNEKTGTVVIGENVKIQNVAIAHGSLSIQVKEGTAVSQPLPFAPSGGGAGPVQTDKGVMVAPGGSTVVSPESQVSVSEEKNGLVLVPEGKTIGELVKALNAIGATPRDLITILQAIKAAGSLQADLEII